MVLPKLCYLLLFFATQFTTITADIGLVENIYCGLKTCYEILDVDRTTDKKTIRKHYKKLSIKSHPDKFQSHKNSGKITTEEFEEIEKTYSIINIAYETLKDDEKKSDYNHYLDHPEDRYYNYYRYYSGRLSAKVNVDVKLVIIGFLSAWSLFQWVGWTNAYEQVLLYALDDNKYRLQAKKIAIEREMLDVDGKLPKKIRRSADFKRPDDAKKEIEHILKLIISENVDVKGGYGKPHWTDVALIQAILVPKYVSLYFYNKVNWWYRRTILKTELNEEEKWTMIKLNLKKHASIISQELSNSNIGCEYFVDKNGDKMWESQCWIEENCETFLENIKEEERVKNLNSGRAKQYRRYMKRNGGENRMTFNENDEGGWEE